MIFREIGKPPLGSIKLAFPPDTYLPCFVWKQKGASTHVTACLKLIYTTSACSMKKVPVLMHIVRKSTAYL